MPVAAPPLLNDHAVTPVAALSAIPIAQSQNVSLLDRTGDYTTVFLGPNREAECSQVRVCTNHQALTAHSVCRRGIDSYAGTIGEALPQPRMSPPGLRTPC